MCSTNKLLHVYFILTLVHASALNTSFIIDRGPTVWGDCYKSWKGTDDLFSQNKSNGEETDMNKQVLRNMAHATLRGDIRQKRLINF